jgi:type 1 fimbriae regulatory protein FimB
LSRQAELEELFISERRQPMSRITVWFLIKQTAAAAGLQGLDGHPHSLRHSCGYSLVNRGTDIRLIQAYLGHRSISSTTRYTQGMSARYSKTLLMNKDSSAK